MFFFRGAPKNKSWRDSFFGREKKHVTSNFSEKAARSRKKKHATSPAASAAKKKTCHVSRRQRSENGVVSELGRHLQVDQHSEQLTLQPHSLADGPPPPSRRAAAVFCMRPPPCWQCFVWGPSLLVSSVLYGSQPSPARQRIILNTGTHVQLYSNTLIQAGSAFLSLTSPE